MSRLHLAATLALLALGSACLQGIGVADIPEPPPEALTDPRLSEVEVSRAFAGQSTEVIVSFVSDQDLRLVDGDGDPLSSVTVDGQRAAYDGDASTATRTAYRYLVSGEEQEGPAAIVITAVNTSGRSSEQTATLTLDFTGPTVAAPSSMTPFEGFVPAAFSVTGSISDEGSGIDTCLVCSLPVTSEEEGVPEASACEFSWRPAAAFGETCTATGLTCQNEDVLAVRLRALDAVGNITDSEPTVLNCDSAPPTANAVELDPSSNLYVGPAFSVTTTFSDATRVEACEVCVAPDGTCDDGDWVGAALDMATGACTATLEDACDDGDDVLVNMRARDVLTATMGTAAGQLRTCDGNPVTLTDLDITGGAEIVGLAFSALVVIDEGSGSPAAICEVCATTNESCSEGDFVGGDLQGDSCRASLTCLDGDALTLQMRVTDAAGNVQLSNVAHRTCDADAEGAGVGMPSIADVASDTHVGTLFVLQAPVDPDAVSCETCVSLTGACSESDWQAGGMLEGGQCRATLTCSDSERLTLGVRARDAVGNAGEAQTISRTCDGLGPVPGVISAANQVDDGFASSTFQLSSTFVDGGARVAGCESCVSSDGVCNDEWTSDGASFADGTCVATVSCSTGDVLTVGLRATDMVGNSSVTGPAAQLVCDGEGPSLTNLSVNGNEASVGVVSPPFTVAVTVDDGMMGAGPEGCEVCVSTDGTCDTEWQVGALAGNTCSAPNLSCADAASLTISARAVDGVGNASDAGGLPVVTRTCDGSGPLVGGLSIDGGGNSFTHVNQAGFAVLMVADDSTSTIVSCEVCVSVDGLCDDDLTEWQPAEAQPSGVPMSNAVNCRATDLFCGTSGGTYTIAMRATDEAGYVTTSAPATRVCDGLAPQNSGPMTFVLGAEERDGQTYVDANGFLPSAAFTEPGNQAGVAFCDVCTGASCPAGGGFAQGPWSIGVFSPAANSCAPPTTLTCTDGEALTVAMRGRDGTGQISAPTTVDVVCDGSAPSVLIDTTLSQIGPGFPGVTATHTGRLFSLEATFDDPGLNASGLASCQSCVTSDGACNTESDWSGAILDEGTGLCHVDTVACVDGQSLTIAMRAIDLLGNTTKTTELSRTCDDSPPLTGAVLTVAGANVTHVRGAGAGFDIRATFTDLISSVSGCEQCVSTDGVCDDEWVAASFDSGTGRCSAAGLTCADLDDLVLQMRASDVVGNEATTTPIARSCDAEPPSVPDVSADNPDPYEIVLDWSEVVELGAGLDTYLIDFDDDQSGEPYQLPSDTPFAGYTLGELNEVLQPCTTHYVRVRALDRVGNESTSSEVQMRTRCGGTGSFALGSALGLYPTTTASTSVDDLVAGEVNGDGRLDLVAPIRDTGAGLDPDIVQVLLGNGDGTFTPGPNATITPMSPNGALTVDLADLDGDGDLDLLHLDSSDNKIRVLFNDGAGAFTYNATLDRGTTSNLSRDIQAIDMNRDGVPDYVVASRAGYVDVRYQHGAGGRGSGAFDTDHDFVVSGGGQIYAVRVADFDGDDIPDIVATSREQARLLLYTQGGTDGRGDGSFTLSDDVAISGYAELGVGDFNTDGVPDVVTSGGDILLGGGGDDGPPGDGTLSAAGVYAVAGQGGISVADLNNDHIDDVVMANTDLYVMMGQGADGRGDASFVVDTIDLADSITHPVIADFNGDGMPDIAVITAGDTLQILLGVGASVVPTGVINSASLTITPNSDAQLSAVGDFNGDSILDLAYTGKNLNGLPPMYILLGVGTNAQGHGSYVPFGSFNTGTFSWHTAVADLDEDGAVDLIVSNRSAGGGDSTGDVTIGWNALLGGLPTATFSRDAAALGGNQGHRGMVLADFNDDGALDIALANEDNEVTVALNDAIDGRGQRAWQPHTDYPLSGLPEYLAVGDFNSDGVDDIAASVEMGAGAVDTVEVLLGDADGSGPAGGRGDGTFGTASVVATGLNFAQAAIKTGDFNGDHITDLAVGGGASLTILLGNGSGGYGNGTFSAGPAFPAVSTVGDLVVVDNRDGIDDIIVTDKGTRRFATFLGNGSDGVGDGTFTNINEVLGSDREGLLQVADLDGDGALDLASGRFGGNQLKVLPGAGTLTTVSP